MTNPYRDMCIELVDKLHEHTSMWEGHEIDLVTRARALLAEPEPPSLKEQALEQLDGIATCFRATHMGDIVCDKIRRALEALDD